ncbi:MAG: DUF1801 domain-containing protein [Acidobacteria bacterium]|jgi:hypothetical protein|nr:MAG: DUF1801 domain-containing protein [Acidobacteriota bacterium]
MKKKVAKKSTKVAKKDTGKRVAAKAAKPRKSAAKSSDATGASKRIDELIAFVGGWRGEWLAEIRRLIHEVDPDVIEDWKWMGTPVWSHDGMYALANAHRDKVKLTFHHGAQLSDPKKLFNNGLTGNKWRAIDIYETDKIDKTALKALLREAIAYNRTHKVPKSKGSRTE